MNLMSAVLVNLWVAGWVLAMVKAALPARAGAMTAPAGGPSCLGADHPPIIARKVPEE
jgi:hypothetical protein